MSLHAGTHRAAVDRIQGVLNGDERRRGVVLGDTLPHTRRAHESS